jgi:Anti-sigma factor NepR
VTSYSGLGAIPLPNIGSMGTGSPLWSGTQGTEGKVLLTEGKVLLGEPVAMRRPAQVPLARMTFPLALADGLRTAFADFVSDPLPERLAALMRQLRTDCEERLGEANRGAITTETSSRIDRRGRR